MRHDPRAAVYIEAKVRGSTPSQLVLLLYEHLVANLRRAALEIAAGDFEGKAESLDRASAITFELLSSLDGDVGGDLAARLSGLYSFFIAEIMAVGRSLDVPRLERVTAMVAALHRAWAEAVAQAGAEPTGTPQQ